VDPSVYRSRRPAQTPLYALLESLFETVKGVWEDLFERRYGFWRGILDGVVARYLDCGIFERGFARIRCPDCATEFLLAFSCKGRGLCSSCGAKRAAEFAAFLQDEVVADVGHAQWVFTVPKLLRPYFMHHRELLGPLCTAAWQTVRETALRLPLPQQFPFHPEPLHAGTDARAPARAIGRRHLWASARPSAALPPKIKIPLAAPLSRRSRTR
jgi:hypothetical protein